MPPELNIYQEERPWGLFRKFTENASTTIKFISIRPNETLSLQSHHHRSEFWRVLAGSGTVEIDGVKDAASKGKEYDIPQGAKHRVGAGSDGMELLEIAFGDFDESDIVRYEDKYGRA